MRAHSSRRFTVDVAFFSGDEQYASEVHTVSATSQSDARQQALRLSADSIYDDPRIPDLHRTATVRVG
ncbi:hypothetical protein [Sphingomonas oryzagri]